MSAHTACSRDEPVPKFGPATRILAPGFFAPSPFVVFSPKVSAELLIYHAPTAFLTRPALQATSEADVRDIVALVKSRGLSEFTLLTLADRAPERVGMFERAGAVALRTRDLPHNARAIVLRITP